MSAGPYVSIGKAARHWGVCCATLRRWADQGIVDARRTPAGHRRFRVDPPGGGVAVVIDIIVRRPRST